MSSPVEKNNFEKPGAAVKAQKIDKLFRTLYDQNQFNGTVLVINQGNIIYQKAWGWSNYEKKRYRTARKYYHYHSLSFKNLYNPKGAKLLVSPLPFAA